jgi:NADPH-dependent ferric siderophore reductase
MNASDLTVQRVRHALKIRLLQVVRTRQVSPELLRVTLTGDDLDDFVSASFDDHVKVFVPSPGEAQPRLPTLGPNGPVFAEGQPRPVARDYTPRRYDPAARELDIEFVLHGDGPATTWAAQSAAGQYLGVAGPRGSFVIPDGFDWHLLIGDESALPAIGRRLEELPATTQAIVVVQVSGAGAQIALPSAARVALQWVHRRGDAGQDQAALLDAVGALALPPGEGYAWVAAEAATVRAVRDHLVGDRGIDKRRIRASSYWKRGAQGVHETLED